MDTAEQIVISQNFDAGGVIDNIESYIENVKYLTKSLKSLESRQSLLESTLEQVLSCLATVLQCVDQHFENGTAPKPTEISMATESARFVRNACAGCSKNQLVINRHTETFHLVHKFIGRTCARLRETPENIVTQDQSTLMTLLKCCVQLLGNASSGCKQNGILVWDAFFDTFRNLLSLADPGLSSCACMVIHSCLLAEPAAHIAQMVTTTAGLDLVCDILVSLTKHNNEWGMFIIEKLLTSPELLPALYPRIVQDDRHVLLDVILAMLQKLSDDTNAGASATGDVEAVSMATMRFICGEFQHNAHSILGLSQREPINSEEHRTVTKLLEVVCAATALRQTCAELLENDDLLKCTINLLHCIHVIGQEGSNYFANISKASKLDQVDTTHPIYGLKRDLVRLIANMAYKHKHNQNLVRELGGIPLVMDHTNIDGRNPFITQWSIFAMRNLLEDNHDNQAILAGMKLSGLSNNVQQLREFGVEAELVGGRVVVKNVNKDDSSPLT